MLVQLEVDAGVEVLAVSGAVDAVDAARLSRSITEALGLQPRALVIDLMQARPLLPHLVEVIAAATRIARGWPHPSLVVCLPPGPVAEAVGQVASVHADRVSALAHVDDRQPYERERIRLEFGEHAPSEARRAILDWAAGRGLGQVADDMVLVVSELVTNAVRHASPAVTLEVELGEHEVVLAVEDGTATRPRLLLSNSAAEGGRGMLLVERLSHEHGVRPRPPGKTVWAALQLQPH